MARAKTQSQGKRLRDGKVKSKDIRAEYDAFLSIYYEEKGRRFCSLVKRTFNKPKYFEEEVLLNMGLKGTIDIFIIN